VAVTCHCGKKMETGHEFFNVISCIFGFNVSLILVLCRVEAKLYKALSKGIWIDAVKLIILNLP
jgi:hypothetical protein